MKRLWVTNWQALALTKNAMNALLQLLKKHWLSVSVFVVYFLLACWELSAQINFNANRARITHEEAFVWGEGLMYGLILFYAISAILVIVIMCYMIARIRQLRYYTTMLLLVLAIMSLLACLS